MMQLLLHILPLKWVSRLFGRLAQRQFSRPRLTRFLNNFAHKYEIDMEEALDPIESYETFNRFFTRRLKPQARPIDPAPNSVVSPVDGAVTTFGEIENGSIIQAKGEGSHLDELIDQAGYRARFLGGTFVVLYLSPRDYHRIHSPLTGHIAGYSYLPGRLFPVNEFSVNKIKRLFSRNERIITYIKTPDKKAFAMIKVGATNVGSIRLAYDDRTITNASKKQFQETFMKPIDIEKGAEIGRFEIGSTVILLFEKGMVELDDLKKFQTVRYGEKIGRLIQ